jgi:hypothetical protein
MRESNWTLYLVTDNRSRLGEREADAGAIDLEIVIQDFLTGKYSNPVRVAAFKGRKGAQPTGRTDLLPYVHCCADVAIFSRFKQTPPDSSRLNLAGRQLPDGLSVTLTPIFVPI